MDINDQDIVFYTQYEISPHYFIEALVTVTLDITEEEASFDHAFGTHKATDIIITATSAYLDYKDGPPRSIHIPHLFRYIKEQEFIDKAKEIYEGHQ